MNDTLLEVHVIFRHGNRTPDLECGYPDDPYKDEEYLPYGHGQLTNVGKANAYDFGKSLRSKYDQFLGPLYFPDILDCWSSYYDRTKATLQLVLAALFPPKDQQIWDGGISWQPIPYKYIPKANDNFLMSCIVNPFAVDAYKQYVEGAGKTIVESMSGVLQYLEEHSGKDIKTPRDALYLITTLVTQKSMGLILPTWVETIWPNIIDVLLSEYNALASTSQFKYYTVGKILEKIVDDTKSKIHKKSKCKMHLYSGHEFTISTLIRCFASKGLEPPSYLANFIVELHCIDGIYGFKVYYQNNLEHEHQLLSLTDSGTFCPFDEFLELIKDILDEKELNPLF